LFFVFLESSTKVTFILHYSLSIIIEELI